MKRVIMKTRIVIPVFAVLLVMALAMASTASAAPPAPNWLPGQPMLAGNQVIAMWLPVPGAVKYIVYMNNGKLMESPANQYIGPAPQSAGEYKFQVKAVDASGVEGPLSVTGVLKIVVIEPPGNIVARPNAEDKSIHLRWKGSLGAIITNVFKAESRKGPFNMVASVQGDAYKDTGLEVGKEYYYSFSSKDVAGKESTRSEPVAFIIEESKDVAVKKIDLDMVIVPSSEVEALTFLGEYEVAELVGGNSYLDSGEIWFVNVTLGQVVVLNNDFETIRKYDVQETITKAGYKWKRTGRIDVLVNDRFVVTDLFSGRIACFDMDGDLIWISEPKMPPSDRNDIWDKQTEAAKHVKASAQTPLFIDENTLWVTDGRVPIMYVLDADNGEVIDWWSNVTDADGKEVLLGRVGSFAKISENEVWLGQGLLHRVVVIDSETRKIRFIVGKERDGFIGGFLGVNSIISTPQDDNIVLVSDAGIGTIQAFDAQTGKYVFHIGGTPPLPDPKLSNERPLMDVGAIGQILFLKNGQLMAKNGYQKYFSVRNVDWSKREVIKGNKK